MIVEIVESEGEAITLREDWDRLLHLTPEASGFYSFAWAMCSTGQRLGKLHIGVVRSPRQAVAIFPTELRPRGKLVFLGAGLGNYAGPVYDPSQLEAAVPLWAAQLRADRRVASIDLQGLRSRSPFLVLVRDHELDGWGRAALVRTNKCPEVDLSGGWESLLERHKRKQRSTWRRKAAKLATLGEVSFIESVAPEEIAAALPRMVELWSERWAGQRVRSGFAANIDIHSQAARALAASRLALLSVLRLDGEIIAFAYGIRGDGYTSSYVLAHDDRFHRYSPGLLLLLRVLEAACERGDRMYDFSLGAEPYKSLWITREQDVYRAIWGRGRLVGGAWSASWARARTIDQLKALRLGGWRALLGHPARVRTPDHPGLPAGETTRLFVYSLQGGADGAGSLARCSYRQMRELLSPRLLRLALERSFRGDDLLLVEGEDGALGVVWRAAATRRSSVAGEHLVPGVDVYYHPVPMPTKAVEQIAERLAAEASDLLVTSSPVSSPGVVPRGQIPPDPATWWLEERPQEG